MDEWRIVCFLLRLTVHFSVTWSEESGDVLPGCWKGLGHQRMHALSRGLRWESEHGECQHCQTDTEVYNYTWVIIAAQFVLRAQTGLKTPVCSFLTHKLWLHEMTSAWLQEINIALRVLADGSFKSCYTILLLQQSRCRH